MRNSKQLNGAAVKRVLLHKNKLRTRSIIPTHMIEDGSLYTAADIIGENLLYELETNLLTKSHTEKKTGKTISVPFTWWDHVKERFAPKWFLSFSPINYRNIEVVQNITTTNMCPHIHNTDNKDCVEFLLYGK